MPRGAQEIQAVFQILFVDVHDIGLERLPLSCNACRHSEVEARGQRARRIVVCVSVIGAYDGGKTSTSLRKLVHPGVTWNPHGNVVPAVGHHFAEVIQKNLASAPGPGAAADQKHPHDGALTASLMMHARSARSFRT